ncbi:hypothetical protein SAMN05216353_12836 [Halobacillus alkaliphilus]|uniref:Uncharacterized protein n=1 Tax=Halobacillus alkaliphilus TaxID=396056 RepID=A0A1I2Q629_9BACI|nr:hypothetical protein SAMN05216353_12836 [Halobacillus alkaliphilus]
MEFEELQQLKREDIIQSVRHYRSLKGFKERSGIKRGLRNPLKLFSPAKGEEVCCC